MAEFCSIVPQIMTLVNADAGRWQIGATDDLQQSQLAAGRPQCFRSWQADEPCEAQDLVAFFTKFGLQLSPGDGGLHVFIHKIRGPQCAECETLGYCRDLARHVPAGL